jgi:lipopolysaccharide/colanic/teichoic acid biosynthesis glycosyltransferase
VSLRSYDPWKRLVDIVVAAVALALTGPLQLAIAVAVRFRLGTPVLFRQERPGKDERIFTLVKFRTMLPVDEAAGRVTDEHRLTRLGSVLRSTSLDELPTLWNVLKGDMSLVGPRPLLVQYLPLYSPEQRRRHEVRPGVTGLAQVNGRNAISWEEKFSYDLQYVERRNFALDVTLLVRTVGNVLRRQGISDTAGPTMTEFMGSRDHVRG